MRAYFRFIAGEMLLAAVLLFFSFQPAEGFDSVGEKPSHTEETLFQEIPSVFGASKFEQKINEAPSSVSIITQAEIKKYGYRTLSDLLRSVRGFFTTYDRNYSYIGVRGFGRPGDYNTRVLLLVNGHRINDNIYDQAPIGTDFPVDIDLIEKVEIIRGPSSSIYGTNAFLGVINIITRRGRDLKGMEVSGEAGSFDTYKGRASYGDRYSNGVELLLSGSYFNSRGQDLFFKEFRSPLTNRGVAQGCDWDNFHSVFSKISFQDFTLEGVYSSRDKGIPTAPWDIQFNDSRTASTDERAYLDFKYEHSFSNDFAVTSRFFYDRYRYDGTYPYNLRDPGEPPAIAINKDRATGDWFGGEVLFTKKLFEGNKLLAGVEFQDNVRQNQSTFDERPFTSLLNSRDSSFRWAIFAEDQYQLTREATIPAEAPQSNPFRPCGPGIAFNK
ncbi:MAG: TonB-dependent receptor plug domain-containing protein [Syntrophobacteraceae bacterium]